MRSYSIIKKQKLYIKTQNGRMLEKLTWNLETENEAYEWSD